MLSVRVCVCVRCVTEGNGHSIKNIIHAHHIQFVTDIILRMLKHIHSIDHRSYIVWYGFNKEQKKKTFFEQPTTVASHTVNDKYARFLFILVGGQYN